MEVVNIDIHPLKKWYCGVGWSMKNEGGGSPIKNEKELQEKLKELQKRYSAYKVIISDKRIKQQTLHAFDY